MQYIQIEYVIGSVSGHHMQAGSNKSVATTSYTGIRCVYKYGYINGTNNILKLS